MSVFKVLSLMSGTSLDGLDLALCSFDITNGKINYEIEKADTLPYSTTWLSKLQNAHLLGGEELLLLNQQYGVYLGELVNEFLSNHNISKDEVDLVSSHGHTIFHQPDKGFTYQLGSGATLAATCQIETVCDFRTQDVVLGGQGAPLVPIGDKLLFSDYDYCLNIGGIANISFEENNQRVAWDICPANMVLNYFSQKEGRSYDACGQLASSGEVINDLLSQLNSLEFYDLKPPKTLGREWVFETIIPLIEQQNINTPDILATFTEHIAIQISKVIGNNPVKSLLITGGGAFNKYLVERINKLSDVTVKLPDNITIDFKEALIFALLGYLHQNGQINILSSVTGASKDHISGVLFRS